MTEKAYRLHIENFLTIETMSLDLSPGVQGFVGRNAAGKTNILTAIQSILSGKHDKRLIKDGENRSEIKLEQVDEEGEVVAYARRIQTQGGNRLDSRLPANVTPKIWLSRLLDEVAINPIRLISEDPVKYLKQHLPVKFEEGDQKTRHDIKVVFDVKAGAFDECERIAADIAVERKAAKMNVTHVKEIIVELEKGLPELPEKPNYTSASIDLAKTAVDQKFGEAKTLTEHRERLAKQTGDLRNDIVADKEELTKVSAWSNEADNKIAGMDDELEKATKHNIEQRNQELDDVQKRIHARYAETEKAIVDSHAKTKEEIKIKQKEWSHKLTSIATSIGKTTQQIEGFEKNLAAQRPIDVEKLHEERGELIAKADDIRNYDQLKVRHDRVNEKRKTRKSFEEDHKEYDDLYKWYAYDLPKTLISRAKLPVEGLEFRDGDLYVNDRHIDRLSSAERHMVAIDLSIAIAKMKGHIAICIDGLEVLDNEHREQFLDKVKGSGIRVIYTRHGKPEFEHETQVVKHVEQAPEATT